MFCSELQSFYDTHKTTAELHVVYIVSGEMKKPSDGSEKKSSEFGIAAKYRRVQFVRDKDLESVKGKYDKVDTCDVYCLHTKPIKVSI